MKRFQTIVVAAALDYRDATLLEHAALFARAAESNAVYFVHVSPPIDRSEEIGAELLVPWQPIEQDREQELRTSVEAAAGLFPAATQVHCVARTGPLVPELVRLLAQRSADLLILGRRPEEHPDLLSDAAQKLLRKAPCSVLFHDSATRPQYDRILVPVDFSDHSREALEVACAIARSVPTASITVQHVYTVPLGWHKSGRTYEDFSEILRGHAERRWQEFLPTVHTEGVRLNVRFDLGGRTPQTILAAADELDAGLLVLGSHGRTRPAAALLGHVADIVCSRTARPVLCVKKKGEVVNFLHALLQLFELESE